MRVLVVMVGTGESEWRMRTEAEVIQDMEEEIHKLVMSV